MTADEGSELAEFWSIFLEDTAGRLTDLTAALRAEDAQLAFRLAHTIKGEARIMRATEVGNWAAQVETEAAAGRLATAAEAAVGLAESFARLAAERGG